VQRPTRVEPMKDTVTNMGRYCLQGNVTHHGDDVAGGADVIGSR